MVEMVIYGVSFDMVGKTPIVLLKTVAGNRFLPIWIGHPEAAAILMQLQGTQPPRPSTHDLFITALGELNGTITQATITNLEENTFFAEICISADGSETTVDCRPSDALALAVRADARIYANEQIVEDSGVEFEQETLEDKEMLFDEFKTFLEDVSPEDFGSPGAG